MQMRFGHPNKPFCLVSEWNKYNKSIATKLVYVDLNLLIPLFMKKFVCYNHKTKYTDWIHYRDVVMSHTKWRWVGHLFTYVKEVTLKCLNNGRVYITQFFPVDTDDRVIMSRSVV